MEVVIQGVDDGAVMPKRYAQSGAELSPPIGWSGGPDSAASFVVILHDLDSPLGTGGTDDLLHWMVWNIPGNIRSLSEGMKATPEAADGTRQISATGPYYRGPAAASGGPAHHYLLEVFALDAKIDVPAVGQSPQAARQAVMAAMAGHVRGKGSVFVRGEKRQ